MAEMMDLEDPSPGRSADLVPSIPDEEAAPEAHSQPKYRPETQNFADSRKKATIDKVRQVVGKSLQAFLDQPQRETLDDNVAEADLMYRCALTKTNAQSNTDNNGNTTTTLSNVASASFYTRIRINTSGQVGMYFRNDELPVKYYPDFESDDYTVEEGQRVADYQNSLLRYTFEADKDLQKFRRALLFNNKYGMQLLSIEWDYREEERTERVPRGTRVDDRGIPVDWKFETKRRVVCDHPTLTVLDLKDWYFDLQIDDMQQQRAVIGRCQMGIEELYQKQFDGEFVNVGKLDTSAMYMDEGDFEGLRDRLTNAGEDEEPQANGLFDVYTAWVRLPLDEKGNWSPKKTVPTWHWTVWAGDPRKASSVCLKLSPNPYWHKQNPFQLIHSHDDDKGAIHLSYQKILAPMYWQETTCWNQFFDFRNRLVNTPFLADEGSIRTSTRLPNTPNQIIYKKRGASVEPLMQANAIPTITTELQYIDNHADQAAVTQQARRGTPFGGRATSTEVQTSLEQSMKPALEDADFIGQQLFPWWAEMCCALWRQYGDPTRKVILTRQTHGDEIRPATLYGPLRVRLTAVQNYEIEILKRAEQDKFVQVMLPFLAQRMGPGLDEFAKDLLKERRFTNVERYFPYDADYDAKRVAQSENVAILFHGDVDEPMPQENHQAHLSVHESANAMYKLLPAEQRNDQFLANHSMHVMQHRELLQTSQQQAAGMASQMAAPTESPANMGQQAGDMISGQMGFMGEAMG